VIKAILMVIIGIKIFFGGGVENSYDIFYLIGGEHFGV
jgi:hypothetical protein